MALMKNLGLCAAVGVLALGSLASANAATLQIVNGTATSIPSGASNEVLGPMGLGNPLAGYATSYIELIGESTILVEYFGKEAGYTNSFTLDGNTLTTAGNDASGTALASFVTSTLSGILNFTFNVDRYDGSEVGVANGSANINAGFDPNFFASIGGNAEALSGDSVWLFLDDGGGGNDDDFDDMAIRLSVTPVPAPAAVWLLGTAVAGLAARRLRSRKTV
jgi:hypothetical protein